ncbi:hypothetical protein ACK3F5_07385 [Photorhabdus asymbiotica UENP]
MEEPSEIQRTQYQVKDDTICHWKKGRPSHHYVASLAFPAVTKEMKRKQRNIRAETNR